MTTGTETGGGDSKASSEATTMRVNADAEQSYDDLTGAALTGIEAHAIEAEAELKTARERAASAQTRYAACSERATTVRGVWRVRRHGEWHASIAR